MDCAEGLVLMREVIKTVQGNVRIGEKRTNIYFDLIQSFHERGCRMISACIGEDAAFDAAYDDLVERGIL